MCLPIRPQQSVLLLTSISASFRAQEDVEVQRKGFTVLVDGTGSKYSNFDPKMPRVLLDGIISRYPGTRRPWPFFHSPCAIQLERERERELTIIVPCMNSSHRVHDHYQHALVLPFCVGRYVGSLARPLLVCGLRELNVALPPVVIRPLLSEKLAERFHIVSVDRVAEFIPRERLLPAYGGTLHYDHRAWLRLQHEKEGLPFSG